MISLNIENDIANIIIDDGRANVITTQVANDFIEALSKAAASAKATIISGGGDKFSAGFDLETIKSSGEAQVEMVTAGFNLLYHLYSHPLPTIAACNGHAIGMGAFILLCADNRIGANHEYKVGLPETAGGMPFTPLLVTVLREQLSRQFYTSAALQSQMCTPQKAIEAGFLDMLVNGDTLISAAQAGANQLMQLPLKQYGDNKQMLRAKPLQKMNDELKKLGVNNR